MKVAFQCLLSFFLASSALAAVVSNAGATNDKSSLSGRKYPKIQAMANHTSKAHGYRKQSKVHKLSTSSPSANSWVFPNFDGYTATSFLSAWKVAKDAYGKGNRAIVDDPANGGHKVLRIEYPKGSYRPGAGNIQGGTGIYAIPLNIPKGTPTVSFSYDIYFPKGFVWNMGGKVPGLYAGHDHCSGGNDAKTCFSTRLMWRVNGVGELYAYIPKNPQAKNICSWHHGKDRDVCNSDYGFSLDRGAFTFTPGRWHSIKQTITPNAVGKALTGKIEVWFDGKPVISFQDLDFRLTSNINILGIDFETFFGGSDSSWATPKTQYVYFNNLALSYQ